MYCVVGALESASDLEKRGVPIEEKSFIYEPLLKWGEGECVYFCIVWGEGTKSIKRTHPSEIVSKRPQKVCKFDKEEIAGVS